MRGPFSLSAYAIPPFTYPWNHLPILHQQLNRSPLWTDFVELVLFSQKFRVNVRTKFGFIAFQNGALENESLGYNVTSPGRHGKHAYVRYFLEVVNNNE